MIEGARLVDAETAGTRKRIAELALQGGRLGMIVDRGGHLVVHFMTRVSGEPQWNTEFWADEIPSSVTDSLVNARRLLEAWFKEHEGNP